MIINTLQLNNIRSYISENFNFNSGINVLFGDIGSGKSTVLFAIEVALFGLKKGGGNFILRKGEKVGSINLILKNEKNSNQIEITREFKKTSSGVTQSSGSIKIGDDLEELSTQELNSFIFKYFNFPMSFVSKDKTLMYRFTHYTPQEQLKEILTTSFDKRLEILRKVFNIDNYKQLQNGFNLTYKDYNKDILVIDTKLQSNEQSLKNMCEENFKNLNVDENILDEITKKEIVLNFELKEFKLKEKLIHEKIEKISSNKSKLIQKQEQIKQSIQMSKEYDEEIKLLINKNENRNEEFHNLKKEEVEYTKRLIDLEEKFKVENLNLKEIVYDSTQLETLQIQQQEISKKELENEKLQLVIKDLEVIVTDEIEKSNELTQLQCRIKDIEILDKKNQKNNDKLIEIKKAVEKNEENQQNLTLQIKEIEFKINAYNTQILSFENISSSKICPTCSQEIDEQHVKSHKDLIKKKIEELQDREKQLLKDRKQTQIESRQLIEKKEHYESVEKLATEQFMKLKIYLAQQNDLNLKLDNLKLKLTEKLKLYEVISIDELVEKYTGERERVILRKENIEKKINEERKLKENFDNITMNFKELNLKINSTNESLKYKKDRISQIETEIKESLTRIQLLQLKLKEYEKDISTQDKIDSQFLQQLEHEKLFNSKLELVISKISNLNSSLTQFQKEKSSIEELIKTTNSLKLEKKKIQDIQLFLREDMTKLCKLLEETLLREIHLDLSLMIRDLFLELVDDKELEIYLRDDFSVIVEQNGFEVEVEQLSGGEKSALALSYRLALKKVIERHFKFETSLSYVMLDEPTDGFSQEQIQKFASILKSSEFEQIFLVSHDSNLLTTGDYTFTIEKENHVSKLL